MSSGFVLPPATMENPSVTSKFLGGWGGKVKSQQLASTKNQVMAKQMAASSLGLPRDTILDDNVFSNLRGTAGKAYEAVKKSVPETVADPQFATEMHKVGMLNSQLAQHFPELVKNDEVADLVTSLAAKQSFPTAAGVDAVRLLRRNGTKNLQSIGDPAKHDLGYAQRKAADAIDDLMERNVTASGNPDLIAKYKAARAHCKSHDVEAATNTSTGEVNMRKLAAHWKIAGSR
jgi:hypothetical protein